MLVGLCTCGGVSGQYVGGVDERCRGEGWGRVSRVSCVSRYMESQRRECPKAGSTNTKGCGRRGSVCRSS